jgi:predicted HTH transcriptional regulator
MLVTDAQNHAHSIDLTNLLVRESEQVEWKENVADCSDVVKTLSAFANDWANLGGGYVVCGAREDKDEYGFPRVTANGLTAARFKEVEGRVLSECRNKVSPSIAPQVHEVPTAHPEARVLVFVMPATTKAHTCRAGDEAGQYHVRISRQTVEARNGILRELLVRKNEVESWDRRICASATTNDLDLVALRDALQRMNLFDPQRGLDDYLSDANALSPFVPPLCGRDPLTRQLRPRNFAVLLFGRHVQHHVPGAWSTISLYPGPDRSEPHAERHELAGSVIEQIRRSTEILGMQSYIAFDKTNADAPNAIKYPKPALTEALVNALAHRDYELPDPTRTTVFSDRIEIVSPGALPSGVKLDVLRDGKATPKWRNQSMAWFLSRLQLAQAEGQGIPTIIRSMRQEGCPNPVFDADESRVTCVLPAHPRHGLMREYQKIEEAISLGEFDAARLRVQEILEKDLLNARAVQLLAEVASALGDVGVVCAYLNRTGDAVFGLPPRTLIQLAEALTSQESQENLPQQVSEQARQLYLHASKGLVTEREIRKVALGLSKAGDDAVAVAFLNQQFNVNPAWRENPFLLQSRGNSYIGLAKQCSRTAKNASLSPQTKRRASEDCRRYLDLARQDLERAARSTDPVLRQTVQVNLEFAERLRERLTRGVGGPARRN